LKRLLAIALAAGMVVVGVSVYQILDSLKGRAPATHRPVTGERALPLPGVLYLAQGGALYRFQNGVFKQLTKEEGWTQPAVSADGSQLVAVKRTLNYSDLYLLSAGGQVERQLTHNASATVEDNHWSFYPQFGPSGIFYSYDPKDPYANYRVDLAVYSMPLAGGSPRVWTSPNHYTGGDVSPMPLKSGALIYAKYAISDQGAVYSQLWIQARALSYGRALTAPEDDCGEPALSADGSQLAMICTHGAAGTVDLEVAPVEAASYQLGQPRVVVAGSMLAAPAFAPDGKSLAYLAPAVAGGGFQLWTVALAAPAGASPSPSAGAAPREVTSHLAFDSSAPPAWIA
jgi:TolB protein